MNFLTMVFFRRCLGSFRNRFEVSILTGPLRAVENIKNDHPDRRAALAGEMDTGQLGVRLRLRLRLMPVQYEWNTRPRFYRRGNALMLMCGCADVQMCKCADVL